MLKQRPPVISKNYNFGNENDNYSKEIPMVIQWVWGPIEISNLVELTKNYTINNIKAYLCENCFFILSKEKFCETVNDRERRLESIDAKKKNGIAKLKLYGRKHR